LLGAAEDEAVDGASGNLLVDDEDETPDALPPGP